MSSTRVATAVGGILAFVFALTGCQQHEQLAPLLSQREQLKINAGETVRVIGTARYLSTTGPTVQGDEFELRVFPKTAWGPELNGKRVEVTGKLADTAHATAPDPSIFPGEYWLDDVTWRRVEANADVGGSR